MAPKTKEVGGGPATGLADDFVKWLSQGLNTGTFGSGQPAGADAFGATQGIGSYLNDILSGGAGKVGGATQQLITTQGNRDADALRARFGAGGGTAFGTGAQFAEGVLRSETAPKITQAIGGLQQNALSMLLPVFANIAQKGITQRTIQQTENPWMTAGKLGLQGGALAASIFAPGVGGPMMAAGASGADVMGAMNNMSLNPMQMSLTPGGGGAGPQGWALPPLALPPWMQ